MASEEQIYAYLGDDPERARALRRGVEHYVPHGAWASVDRVLSGREWLVGEAAAEHLSIEGLALHAVLDTTSETIWIRAFERTALVRELLFTADRGWVVREGARLPGEDSATVAALLARNDLSAGFEGYDLLDALITGATSEAVVGTARLPEGVPACEHGYFQTALALPSGRVLVGGDRMPFGWASGTYVVDLEGRIAPARDTDGQSLHGVAVGVTAEGLVVTHAVTEGYKSELYLFRETPDGMVSLTKNPKKLAIGSQVAVIGGGLFVVEKGELRAMNEKARVRWRRTIAHPVDELFELEGGGLGAHGGGETTFVDSEGRDVSVRQRRVARGVETATTEGRVRLADDAIHFEATGGGTSPWPIPGLVEVGPSVGSLTFVRSSLGTWGEGWWSFATPPRAQSVDPLRSALVRLGVIRPRPVTP